MQVGNIAVAEAGTRKLFRAHLLSLGAASEKITFGLTLFTCTV
jgi:hypothetical protein